MSIEIRKPTSGSKIVGAGTFTNAANAYNGTTANESTNFSTQTSPSGDYNIVTYINMQIPTQTYSAAVLNVSWVGSSTDTSTTDGGEVQLEWSDDGTGWAPFTTDGYYTNPYEGTPVTKSAYVNVYGKSYSNLVVRVTCTGHNAGGTTGTGTAKIYDIWLEGTYTIVPPSSSFFLMF